MALDRVFNTPTMTIDQERYEDLIRKELKYEQYKTELERLDETEIIRIVEAEKDELKKNNIESEEK